MENPNEKTYDELVEYSAKLTEAEKFVQTKIDKTVDWDKVYGSK